MKRILCLCLSLLAVAGLLISCNETPQNYSEGLEFTSNGDGTCYVSGIGRCNDENIVIPDKSPARDKVTGIGARAFQHCMDITSVTIPDGVTKIGYQAFRDCDLTRITIPEGVTLIDDEAFAMCHLYTVTLPASIKYIGVAAFASCLNLESISIPESVTSIGGHAFYECTSLSDITIPQNITSIDQWTFSDCYNLSNITIPEGVTSIGEFAFQNCRSLTSITIPKNVTSISDGAFAGCSKLQSISADPQNTVYCSTDNCLIDKASRMLVAGGLNSVIPTDGSVKRIGDYAFAGRVDLENITIPECVTRIGEYAFDSCKNLANITIPQSVTSIGNSAFGNTAYSNNSSNWSDGVLYIGNYLVGVDYTVPDNYSVKAGTTCICDEAFYWRNNLVSITIPASVTSIGSKAFVECSNLKNINVDPENSVYCSIGNCLIGKTSKVLIVGCNNSVIPTDGSIASIGEYAFCGCDELANITIPLEVKSIGKYAFEYCKSLATITFQGTKKQWRSVWKDDNWDYGTGSYTIIYTEK